MANYAGCLPRLAMMAMVFSAGAGGGAFAAPTEPDDFVVTITKVALCKSLACTDQAVIAEGAHEFNLTDDNGVYEGTLAGLFAAEGVQIPVGSYSHVYIQALRTIKFSGRIHIGLGGVQLPTATGALRDCISIANADEITQGDGAGNVTAREVPVGTEDPELSNDFVTDAEIQMTKDAGVYADFGPVGSDQMYMIEEFPITITENTTSLGLKIVVNTINEDQGDEGGLTGFYNADTENGPLGCQMSPNEPSFEAEVE